MKTLLFIIFTSLANPFADATNQLEVSDNQTTHLLCPDVVTYVNAGNLDLIHVEIIPELPSVVRIKAARPFEGESSLTVVCRDNIYSFKAVYSTTCDLNLELTQFRADKLTERYGSTVPMYRVKAWADQMQLQKRTIFNRGESEYGIAFKITGIGIKENLLFMQFTVTNHTNIIYKMEDVKFMIRDKKKKKAVNVQAYPVTPEYFSHNALFIAPGTTMSLVVAFKTFTIPGRRAMEVSLFEKTGGHTGRNLSFDIKNKDILKAKPF